MSNAEHLRAYCFKKTHGLSRDANGNKTRLFRIWSGIKTRCFNSKVKEYPRYGGRGITLCSEWLDFSNFHTWAIINEYNENLSIDRKDNNGNYEPGNCFWVTRLEQNNNRRSNIYHTINGVTKTQSQWAKEYCISQQTLFGRLKLNWPIELALKTPTDNKKQKLKYLI